MRISNIHIESAETEVRLVCDCVCSFSNSKQMWFSVQPEFADYLTDDVYDAFLVASLYPAMFYQEPIEVEGKVSKKLYFNIMHYVESIITSYRSYMHRIDIKVKGFADAKKTNKLVGTGFSAGVDSFSTFYDHFVNEKNPDYKINTLFFFNVGSHGGGTEKARRLFNLRYDLLKSFPDEVGLPYVKMDSNVFDYCQDQWEYEGGAVFRIAAILVFQKVLSKYYLSNAVSYGTMMTILDNKDTTDLSVFADPYINPLLSPDGCEIICDGAQWKRSEKVERIMNYEPVYRYLNVCVNQWGDDISARNCSHCPKCLRTLSAIDSLGKLDKVKDVFDLDVYAKYKKKYDYWLVANQDTDAFALDNVDLALRCGKKLPGKMQTKFYFAINSLRKFSPIKVMKDLRYRMALIPCLNRLKHKIFG